MSFENREITELLDRSVPEAQTFSNPRRSEKEYQNLHLQGDEIKDLKTQFYIFQTKEKVKRRRMLL